MARINRIDSSHDIGRPCKVGLISKTYTSDSIGNKTPTETIKYVFAGIRSVYGTEFASAGENGIKPAWIFTIWDNEYSSEDELEYNNEVFSIYRTYIRKDNRVELYTEKKVGSQ